MIPPDVDQVIERVLDELQQLFGTLTNEQEVEAWETIIEFSTFAMQGLVDQRGE